MLKYNILETYVLARFVLSVIVVIVTITLVGNQSILSITNSLAAILAHSSNGSNSDGMTKFPHIMDSNLTVEIVVDGLNMPTTMAFLGKDDFLILQKNGSLVRVVDGILSNKTRLDVPVAKGFYQGLLGIAITNQSIQRMILTYFCIILK